MTDTTAQEPTMEEILASIRRIISEDDAPAVEATPEPEIAPEPAPAVVAEAPAEPEPLPQEEEIFDLTDRYEAPVAETIGDQPEILGMVRFDVDPATNLADVAFVVRDEWHGKGVGTVLMRRVAEVARARGLAGFQADVLSNNHAMLGIFHKSGLFVISEREGAVQHLTATFDASDPAIRRNSLLPAGR